MKRQLEKWVRSRKCYLYLLLGTAITFFMARASGSKAFFPALMTLVIYPVYALDLSQGRRDLALFHTLFWAFASSVCMILLVRYDDVRMAQAVFKGIEYRDEMFQWILTGEGREGSLKLFLPEHLKHFLLFCASSFFTAGVWGLAFGSLLLNYMNFYVGSLSLHSHHPLLSSLVGWPPWSVLRAIGFVLCGIALSEPLLSQLLRFRMDRHKCYQYFFVGLGFVLVDILIKANLASFWRDLLRRLVTL
ncbi:MAG: hypothetical protein HY590_00120 [Candidatus Omnitrophica bacterium]|nr:hypothetical protein [Candidatus Omnitrophota bacterium]